MNNTIGEYAPMTDEEIKASAEQTIARRDTIMANMLEIKKFQLAKMKYILNNQKRVEENRKAKAKTKRKAAKKARRNNRSK